MSFSEYHMSGMLNQFHSMKGQSDTLLVLPETTIFGSQTKTTYSRRILIKTIHSSRRQKLANTRMKENLLSYMWLSHRNISLVSHPSTENRNFQVQSSIPPTHVSQHGRCETSPRTRQRCTSEIARTAVSLQPPFQVPPVKRSRRNSDTFGTVKDKLLKKLEE